MRRPMSSYIFLTAIAAISGLLFFTSEYEIGRPDPTSETLTFLVPGILYSAFIIVTQHIYRSPAKKVFFFFILLFLYGASVLIGFVSWGLGVPIVGGIGAVVIKKLFSKKTKPSIAKELFIGSTAGLVGLGIFYAVHDLWTDGIGFGIIIVLWQLAFGFLWINEPPIKRLK